MEPIYIVRAKRTPFGKFLGSLADCSPVDLGVAAGNAVLEKDDYEKIDLVVFGNVLSAGHGMNISRQITLALGIPEVCPAYTVNQMCASGMTAIHAGIHAIRSGEAKVVLCGGTESMSQSARLIRESRKGKKLGDIRLVDSMLCDGLSDPSTGEHMGMTAERLAERYHLTREEQDAFTVHTQQAWGRAETAGIFAGERIAMELLSTDEHARPDSALEKLASLKPAFAKEGTVTAGNASGVNDGAAALLLANETAVRENGWQPLAKITGWSTVGCDPKTMGLGPVYAIRKLLQRFAFDLKNFDAIEINEAFAAQTLACVKELGLETDKLNPNGGAIAMGHPIGTSGARLAAHLSHQIANKNIQNGLASLCVGGGMGIALSLSRP